MDPLSVAASVVGLLGAAGKITSLLHGLVTKIKDAPSLARTVVTEVADITAALGQLQAYVLGTASANPARSNLILLEQVLATLSGCVATYSELEAAVDSLNINADMGTFDRAVWTLKEPGLVAIVQRLQNHKSSLTLMLTILQCKSQQEAQTSMQKLQSSVERLLKTNEDLAARLKGLEKEGSMISGRNHDDISTIKSNKTSRSLANRLSLNTIRRSIGFAFEEDLQSSRVYRKAVYRHSQVSLTSSGLFSAALSVFSDLSLSQVSNISVYALPVYSTDLYNNEWYTFGDAGAEAALATRSAITKTKAEPQSNDDTPGMGKRPRLGGRFAQRSTVLSSPANPVHVTHVGRDEESGVFTGLPKEWQKLLVEGGWTGIDESQPQNFTVRSLSELGLGTWDGFENPRPAPPIPGTGRKSAPANAASTNNDLTMEIPLPLITSAESARSPLGENKYAADEYRNRPAGSAEHVKATEEIREYVQAGPPPSPQSHREDYSPIATLRADVDDYNFRPYKRLPALPPSLPSPKSTSRSKNTAWLPSSLSRTPARDPIRRATDPPDEYFGEIQIGIGT